MMMLIISTSVWNVYVLCLKYLFSRCRPEIIQANLSQPTSQQLPPKPRVQLVLDSEAKEAIYLNDPH